jgi:hypothetical protein
MAVGLRRDDRSPSSWTFVYFAALRASRSATSGIPSVPTTRGGQVMVRHIALFERLFEVDLRAPAEPAKRWFDGRWVRAALTNEEVLFNPGAESLPTWGIRAVAA